MIKGAIFDLDGTLLDSMFIWDTIGETYLRSIGYEPKEDLKETFKSLSLQQAARYYQSEYGVTLSVEEIVNGVNKRIEQFYLDKVLLKPGVKDFLHQLQEKGVKMCIATATDAYLARAALKRCGAENCFSKIFTCGEVGYGKDEPVIYREAWKYLGTEKEETIVFEDTYFAVKTAKADGFLTVAVQDDHEEHQAELKELADIYLERYDFEFFRKSVLGRV